MFYTNSPLLAPEMLTFKPALIGIVMLGSIAFSLPLGVSTVHLFEVMFCNWTGYLASPGTLTTCISGLLSKSIYTLVFGVSRISREPIRKIPDRLKLFPQSMHLGEAESSTKVSRLQTGHITRESRSCWMTFCHSASILRFSGFFKHSSLNSFLKVSLRMVGNAGQRRRTLL